MNCQHGISLARRCIACENEAEQKLAMPNVIRSISFIADVTEYAPAQGKDYTQPRRVTFSVHADQQTLMLESVDEVSESDYHILDEQEGK